MAKLNGALDSFKEEMVVTVGEGENKNEEGKGFAGLSSLVSDVDTTPPPAAQLEAAAAAPSAGNAAPQTDQGQASPIHQTYQEFEPPQSSPSTGVKWVLGIVAFIGVLFLIGQSDKSRTTPTPAYLPPTQTAVPGYSPAPVELQAPTIPQESMPPVGQDLVLSTVQIRYCLAEKIRLESAKSALNNYINSDVDRFNAMVGDYNSRCGSYRYRSGALESARSDIEPYRSQLQSEGGSRFARPSNGPLSTEEPTRPNPDAIVQAIQQKLNELGYNAGSPDGLMGSGTVAAIIAFQKDRGLSATGTADQSLLNQLQQISVSQSRDSHPANNPVQLSPIESASLEAACSTDKYVNGPAAYRACVERQRLALAAGVRRPNLNSLSSAEQQSIEAACSTDKYVNGPAAYNQCLANQLSVMSGHGARRPDLSELSSPERQSIEAACSTDKYVNGPAAYNKCLVSQLDSLRRQSARPDLSNLSSAEKNSIDAACSTDKYVNGPAAYNQCISQQLARLRKF